MYDRAPLLMSQLNTEEWEPTQKRGEKYHIRELKQRRRRRQRERQKNQ